MLLLFCFIFFVVLPSCEISIEYKRKLQPFMCMRNKMAYIQDRCISRHKREDTHSNNTHIHTCETVEHHSMYIIWTYDRNRSQFGPWNWEKKNSKTKRHTLKYGFFALKCIVNFFCHEFKFLFLLTFFFYRQIITQHLNLVRFLFVL